MQEHDERRSVIPYVHCVLYYLCSQEVENGIVRSEYELMLCLASLVLRECRESLECAASASLLYLKGGAYMAVESPIGGPNDVVFNTNGLVLL